LRARLARARARTHARSIERVDETHRESARFARERVDESARARFIATRANGERRIGHPGG
jgi:hypothetical protein